MEHRYQTRRNEIHEIVCALSQLSVLVAINTASFENIAHIMRREDTLISDISLRDSILPQSSHLGLLVSLIEEVATKHGACKSGELVNALNSTWRKRLGGSDPFSDTQNALLESVASSLRHTRDKMQIAEGTDTGSSSPSDYSDSDTNSSDGNYEDEDQEDGEEEDGEEEEEEEETPTPPRRCRR